jgi:hypothetical protein
VQSEFLKILIQFTSLLLAEWSIGFSNTTHTVQRQVSEELLELKLEAGAGLQKPFDATGCIAKKLKKSPLAPSATFPP